MTELEDMAEEGDEEDTALEDESRGSYDIKKRKNTVVITLRGPVPTDNTGLAELKDELMEGIRNREPYTNVTIDLSQYQNPSSSLLGLCCGLRRASIEAGKDFALRNPSDHIHEMLKITKLSQIFRIENTGGEAAHA